MNKTTFRLAAVQLFAIVLLGSAAPPVIELAGPNPLTNECHTPYVEPGIWIKGAPVALAAGGAHSLALKGDGTVVAWGSYQMGETNVPPNLGRAIAVAANSYFSLAVTEAGAVVGWGDGAYGELNIPTEASHDVVAVAAGYYHALALRADGSVVGWRFNSSGQTTVPPSATNVIAIAGGQQHSLALRADGTVVAWGSNLYGEGEVPANITNLVAIAAGHSHNLGLRADGKVVTWGYDDQFHLLRVPARATNVVAIAAADQFSVAVRADGTVVTWGLDLAARITVIPASATNVVGVAAGGESYFADYCLAWKADGSAVGWGANSWAEATTPAGLSSLDLPSFVTGEVDTETPGAYTLTYTTTNILGEVGTATRTVVVADTTPPELICPTNRVVELMDTAGATVSFSTSATDLCAGLIPVTCFPPSGSKFPVGTNTVVCEVVDGSGNGAQCSFTVTVVGARGVKRNVLTEMREVAQSQHIPLLNQAIRSLSQSLTAGLWQDELRLNPKPGGKVFIAEAETVLILRALQQQRHHTISSATLQDWIARLVKVDQLLAVREIEIAIESGVSPIQLKGVAEMLEQGNKASRNGNYALAIAFYERAWSMTIRLTNRLTGGQ